MSQKPEILLCSSVVFFVLLNYVKNTHDTRQVFSVAVVWLDKQIREVANFFQTLS